MLMLQRMLDALRATNQLEALLRIFALLKLNLDCKDFYLHKSCAELPALNHYHAHPLILKEQEDDDITREGSAACYICNASILAGSLAYTCIRDDDFFLCQGFYLHKSCGELQTQINYHKHTKHPLALSERPDFVLM